MRRQKYVSTVILFVFLFLSAFYSGVSAETADILDTFLTGEFHTPAAITISSPEYLQLAQYEGERVDSLNRLLKHFSICIELDGNSDRTIFSIDQTPFYTITDSGISNPAYQQLLPDGSGLNDADGQTEKTDGFTEFLDSRFFHMNRLLDGMYDVFEKAADLYKDYSSVSSANLNFSGYGRGVRRITIQLPSDKVQELFPASFPQLEADGYTEEFLGNLIFQGNQKIILLYDKDDHLIRVNYDGILGLSADQMRKVSVVWKCFRDDHCRKDSVVLKTPEVRGYDRENITYERNYTVEDNENAATSWNMQIDQKQGQIKRKTQYSADISCVSGKCTGEAAYNLKQDGRDQTVHISSVIQKENGSEYNGILEITNKKGKIVTSSIKSGISLSAGASIRNQSVSTNTDLEDHPAVYQAEQDRTGIQTDFLQILIPKLLDLPKEDLSFLSKDIPDDIWNALMQYK